MKLISLNLWAGIVYQPLISFLKEQAKDTDVFCFQELFFGSEPKVGEQRERENIFEEISAILEDFVSYPMLAPVGSQFQGHELSPGLRVGQGIFVHKNISVVASGEFHAYEPGGEFAKDPKITITGNLNYVNLKLASGRLLIANLHGAWQAEGKGDTPVRLQQSKIIRDFFDTVQNHKVLVGDFNMLPDTESMALLEKGMVNLVKKYGITSTRSKLYKKEILFSDYALVSPGLKVRDFRTFDITVSDHLPLMLVFGA